MLNCCLATHPSPARTPKMQYFNDGRFRHQVRFLRRQFLQDEMLPISNVLSDQAVARTGSDRVVLLDRIYSPLVTPWVFWTGSQCGSIVPRSSCSLNRSSTIERAASVFRKDGCLLSGQTTSARGVFSNVARQTGSTLESNIDLQRRVERTPRIHLRWLNGNDARYH